MTNNVLLTALLPHPPVVITAVGGCESLKVKNTEEAMQQVSREIMELAPETIVLVTPHAQTSMDNFSVYGDDLIKGNFGKFGAPDARFIFKNDIDFIKGIDLELKSRFTKLNKINTVVSVDHGSGVPLYFLYKAGFKGKVVILNYSTSGPQDQLALGRTIRKIANDIGRKIVFIASGDLSHKLSPTAPAGYSPTAFKFDNLVIEAVKTGDYESLSNINDDDACIIEDAGECGYPSIMVALGVVDEKAVNNRVLSYESPFGVGYLVATL